MSMAPSRPRKKIIECTLLAGLALAAWGSAHALKSDKTQIINVAADHQEATLGGNGQVTLSGHVKIDQGSLGIRGDKAIGYENSENQWDHAVVTGAPATFHQKLDNGSTVNGSSATIEYLVAEDTVILTGNATVVQQGRGTFHGAKLTYNTDSGKIIGDSAAGGQVHMTFRPKSATGKPAATSAQPAPPTPAAAAAPASAPATAAPAAPASVPVAATPAAPASAASAGTH